MDALKICRRWKGWSQRELARQAGMGQDTISGIESGKHKPRPSTLRKLADALGIEVAELFREELYGEPGPWDVPPEGSGPKEPQPAPKYLLEEAGAETCWLTLTRREWLDAMRGAEEEKARNLLKVGRETLQEYLAVYPYMLSGNRDGLEQLTISREYEDVVKELLLRRVLLSMWIERLLREATVRDEWYQRARALLAELKGVGVLAPAPDDEEKEKAWKEASRELESVA